MAKRKELEKDIEADVVKAVVGFGVISIKFKIPNRRNAPDRLFLCSNGRAAFIEFKRPGEKPRRGQYAFLQVLREMGYPAIWADNREAAIEFVQGVANLPAVDPYEISVKV